MSNALRLDTLGQISMRVKDLARATAFYRDTLAVPLLFEVPNLSFFDVGGVRLMLTLPSSPEHDHPGSILYFSVDDVEAAHDLLAGRGVRFDRPPQLVADMGDYELWMAFFKDSEDNQLALMSERAKG